MGDGERALAHAVGTEQAGEAGLLAHDGGLDVVGEHRHQLRVEEVEHLWP